MSKKTTSTCSLTREKFLSKLAVTSREVHVDGLGTFHVRQPSELQASRRVSAMFDKNGEIIPRMRELRRVHTIIDALVDKDGNPLFTDKDVSDLLSLDANLLTQVYLAVDGIVEEESGNEEAE